MTPDPSDVQALFARHYFYFALLATLGVLQIAVSVGGYSGMWLLPGRMSTRIAGVVLVIAGAALFFLMPLWVDGPWAAGSVEADSATRLWGKADWADLGAARNVNDIDGGLSGTGQATWFPLAALIAGIVSVAAGTANRRLFPDWMRPARAPSEDVDGIERMVGQSYFSALAASWSRFKREIRGDYVVIPERSDRWSIVYQLLTRLRR